MSEEVVPTWGFMGGSAEFVKAGEASLPDRDTGELRLVKWPNHIRMTCGRRIIKLNKAAAIATAELMANSKDFRKYVDQCP